MHARFTWIQGEAGKIDDTVEQIKREVVPLIEGADGFEGFTLHVDRSSGQVVGVSYWESEEAMKANEATVREARESAASALGGEPRVSHFEVAIDTQA